MNREELEIKLSQYIKTFDETNGWLTDNESVSKCADIAEQYAASKTEWVSVTTNDLLEQLDKWISDCQLQADVFFDKGMEISEASSLAMKVAYTNVKTIIENNQNNK